MKPFRFLELISNLVWPINKKREKSIMQISFVQNECNVYPATIKQCEYVISVELHENWFKDISTDMFWLECYTAWFGLLR